MNVHIKRKVTPKKLLGQEKTMTDAERAEKIKRLNQVLKKGGNSHSSNNR